MTYYTHIDQCMTNCVHCRIWLHATCFKAHMGSSSVFKVLLAERQSELRSHVDPTQRSHDERHSFTDVLREALLVSQSPGVV